MRRTHVPLAALTTTLVAPAPVSRLCERYSARTIMLDATGIDIRKWSSLPDADVIRCLERLPAIADEATSRLIAAQRDQKAMSAATKIAKRQRKKISDRLSIRRPTDASPDEIVRRWASQYVVGTRYGMLSSNKSTDRVLTRQLSPPPQDTLPATPTVVSSDLRKSDALTEDSLFELLSSKSWSR